MITCLVNVKNEFLYIAIENILNNVIDEDVKIYRKNKSGCAVIFIEFDNIPKSEFIGKLKSLQIGTVLFFIITRKLSYHLVNLAKKYKATIIFKEDFIDVTTQNIKDSISSLLVRKENRPRFILHTVFSKKLTHCEKCVIDFVNRGFSGVEIATMLGRSQKTISGHKRSAMKKMGVRTNIELHILQQLN